MSGGQTRRFPRTAGVVPASEPKIEREKIRHRRPNDLRVEGEQRAEPMRPAMEVEGDGYDDATYYEDADQDWSDQYDDEVDASTWDNEPEDDWTLETGGENEASPGFAEDAEDESGVVWDEDALVEEGYAEEDYIDQPDEIAFGSDRESSIDAPEVELAGRRDVRPKAPKPAREAPVGKPTRAPQTSRPQPAKRRPQPSQQAQPHQVEPTALADRQHGFRHPVEPETVFEPRARPAPAPRPAAEDIGQSDEGGRFSRTRATIGAATGFYPGGDSEEVLQQPRNGPAQRRRQAHAPSAPRPSSRPRMNRQRLSRYSKRSGKVLLLPAVLLLLLGGGWFGYQSMGQDGIQPLFDRLSSFIPLPDNARTAADTSFAEDNAGATDEVSPEQALAELEERVLQQNQSTATPTSPVDGPPIPKLKPLPGDPPETSQATDQGQLAAGSGNGEGDNTSAATILEQILRYINPG